MFRATVYWDPCLLLDPLKARRGHAGDDDRIAGIFPDQLNELSGGEKRGDLTGDNDPGIKAGGGLFHGLFG